MRDKWTAREFFKDKLRQEIQYHEQTGIPVEKIYAQNQ
jgi:hypothetical protein